MLNNSKLFFVRQSVGIDLFKIQTRWKNRKDHWSTIAKAKKNTERALEYFDDFYQKVFNNKWASVRLGLLSQNKYCAVVNNYSDSERIEQELESLGAINVKNLIKAQLSQKDAKSWKRSMEKVRKMDLEDEMKLNQTITQHNPHQPDDEQPQEKKAAERLILPSEVTSVEGGSPLYDFMPASRLKGMEGFVPESQHFDYYKPDEGVRTEVEIEDRLAFPDTLKVFTFETGNISRFPKPKRGSTGVTDYYLMDGSSVLPVLCLGLEPGDRVLDLCAAPGGKSLLCLQTLTPKVVVSNDSSLSRLNRLKRIYSEYFYDLPKMESTQQVVIANCDARDTQHLGSFNKVLVDVPCTTDRMSVNESDNNIFKPDRVKERIRLPELQADILTAALKQVEDGGTVVYSTCSLSPVQNDGVVHMALQRIYQETNDNIIVKDLSRVMEPFKVLYKFGTNNLRYGHLIVSYLPSNFGPMYFCKLVKRNQV